eukprot:21409-Heterococcus_DN1.PRE.2
MDVSQLYRTHTVTMNATELQHMSEAKLAARALGLQSAALCKIFFQPGKEQRAERRQYSTTDDD